MCAQLFFHQVFSFSAPIYDEQIEVLNHVGQSMSTKRVVICGVARTPIGSFMGTLSSISAVDLGIMAVKELC